MVNRPLATGAVEPHPALGIGAPTAAGALGASTVGSAAGPPLSPAGWLRSTFMGGASVEPFAAGVGAPPVMVWSDAGCGAAFAEGTAGVAGAVFVSGGPELSLEHAVAANTRLNEIVHGNR